MHIQPHSENRRAFAKWAVRNRIRTSSSNTFHVPDDMFADIPEDVLLGALVDGQPFRPGDLDESSDRESFVIDVNDEPVNAEAESNLEGDDADDEPASEPEPEPEPDSTQEPDTGTSVPF